MNIKYAVLVLNEEKAPAAPLELGDGIDLRVAALESLVDEDLGFWQSEFGKGRWRRVSGERAIVLAYTPARRPDILDQEHHPLTQACSRAWMAYLLARSKNPAYGTTTIFLGHGVNVDGEIRLENIRGYEEKPLIRRPDYLWDEDYLGLHDPEEALMRRVVDHEWSMRTAAIFHALTAAIGPDQNYPKVLHVALDSYWIALASAFSDFRVPGFVRAAEAVLALPRGKGSEEFAQRGARFLSGIENDPFLARRSGTAEQFDLVDRLRKLYALRNACVHGKVPIDYLSDSGELDYVTRYEYLAEVLANATIRWSLRHHRFLHSVPTRSLLEKAWALGHVPGLPMSS